MVKILVIDEDIQFNELVKTYLEDCEYEVVLAAGGRDGFEKAKSGQPDLIILDALMTEEDGFTVLIEIRKDETAKEIPIILCAGAKSDYIDEIPEVGPDATMTKPFKMPELLAKIEEML